MTITVGIDVGGTFTDFLLVSESEPPRLHKTLSTPHDPAIAVMNGLEEIAARMSPSSTLARMVPDIGTIVHGTTVTTNATLTRRGAKTGLITTTGVRDALEMRRGIREEQYNNRYTNVVPLVPRYLRIGVGGRMDRRGEEVEPLDTDAVHAAVETFRANGIEAVAICLMNSYANPEHEDAVAEIVREAMPGAYVSVSSEILPSIRFYERVSTTVLNAYVGPTLDRYMKSLLDRLRDSGFGGRLLVMQSNGGVTSVKNARETAASTLLSGPAAGPRAGLHFAQAQDQTRCIVVDMGGTSFEAALVVDRPLTSATGTIDRLRLALPMLDINTIGAGGGSIGWLDEGGLLRMGPQSAGAVPGPVCYGKGGTRPTTTDANVILGLLDPSFFAGGSIMLDAAAARAAIDTHVAKPLGLSVEEAAAGMFRIACTNMAEGVRDVTIRRGYDPREFPMVVAGGAGPLHSCEICRELEIPMQIVPREASILCAAGMLLSDLEHDFVQTYVGRLDDIDFEDLNSILQDMKMRGAELLSADRIPISRQKQICRLDCRYLRQYHEVSVEVPAAAVSSGDTATIARAFHEKHNQLFGYSLEDAGVPIELVNLRLTSIGETAKPELAHAPEPLEDVTTAGKGNRKVFLPDRGEFADVPVFDGHRFGFGNRVNGPAIIELRTTSIFVGATFDCICDRTGSFVLADKARPDLIEAVLEHGAAT